VRGGSRPGAGRPKAAANTSNSESLARASARKSDLTVEWRNIGDLIPYARNARSHSDAQVAQIAGSIREFGFTNPVLIDPEGGIIAGHGRVLAARKLDMEQVPCIELAHLSEAQKRAYVIADNKLALNAGWDENLLRLELADLRDMAFDLSLTGFALDEIKAWREPELRSSTDAEAIPMRYQILVDCQDERHQAQLLEQFQAQGYKCRPLIL